MRDLSGGWGDPCVRPSQAKHHRVGDPGDVSFLSFLKIKMEKSGLCMAPGVHRLHEACGWVMAAPARRLRLGEVRGSRRRNTRAVPGRAKAALLGEDVTVTEVQGGMTCLRPPCGKGEKPVPLRPGPAQLPGEGGSAWEGWKLCGVSVLRGPGLSPRLPPAHSDLRPGVLSSGPAICASHLPNWALPV